jgi:formyl-CoA transferase
MILADMGADVIKIEEPGKGDDTRQFTPRQNGESVYYININRNKKGVTLNLKNPKAKALFLEMVKKADVVVENYRPGTMEKLELGYDELKKVNPRIIYAAISGFGHTGRYKARPGYDIIAQAMSGLMSTTGWPGGEPTRTGTAVGDVLGGLGAAIGILGAVHHCAKTGEGQKIDVALVDSVVSALEIINMIYLVEKRIPQRIGNRYEANYPYDTFHAENGMVVIGAANDKLWDGLCQEMELPDLVKDPRFLTIKDRIAHHEELKKIIEDWTKFHKVEEIVENLLARGVPSAPIYDIAQVTQDPHIAGDREMFVDIEHPVAGKMKITGSHIKMSATPPKVRTASPLLGEHNVEIYGEWLGLSSKDIEKLKQEGAM